MKDDLLDRAENLDEENIDIEYSLGGFHMFNESYSGYRFGIDPNITANIFFHYQGPKKVSMKSKAEFS